MDQRTSGGNHQQLTVEKLVEYLKHKRILLRVEDGRLKWKAPAGAVTSSIQTILKHRQFEIARHLGGEIKTGPAAGVIDKDWIEKANKWWAENVHCWVGLWPTKLSQPPYVLADSLGLIDLKEMANANSPDA